jgi:TIR domain
VGNRQKARPSGRRRPKSRRDKGAQKQTLHSISEELKKLRESVDLLLQKECTERISAPIIYVINDSAKLGTIGKSVIPPSTPFRRTGIFVSYSHRDRKWLNELKTMLSPLIRDGSMQVWDDTQINTGAVWKEEIEKALASAKVAVLLVSAHFLASDFIDKNELPPLLAAARDDGLKICWIYVSAALYERTEIAKYQAAHDVKRPLNRMSPAERQGVLSKVAFEIEKLAG